MWGIEHTAMAAIASAVVMFLFVKRPFWALCAALSQIPFWAGSADYFAAGLDPIHRNLAVDIAIAAVFLLLAHITGKMACIFLCIVLFSMAILDLLAVAGISPFYLALHELFHYIALVIALGGHRVGGVSGFGTHMRFGRGD